MLEPGPESFEFYFSNAHLKGKKTFIKGDSIKLDFAKLKVYIFPLQT